jgi:hypothetical protein
MSNIYKFAKEIEVISTPGLTKKRIGRLEDGGYVVLDEISKRTEVLYSYGVSDDWSFEEDYVNTYDCEARLFDHTVNGITSSNPKIYFKKQGLGLTPSENFDTLYNHMSENNDLKKRSALKIDIEWNEWDFFNQVSDEFHQHFDQIICEFHIIPVEYNGSHTPYFTGFYKDVYEKFNEMIFGKYLSCIQKIKANFCIYHVHVNNSLGVREYDGCSIPYLLEVGFVHRRFLPSVTEASQDTFPVKDLDFPNKPYKPEILNFYPLVNEE